MLIRDADILLQFAHISGSMRYDSAEASLRMVELKYIVPILGTDLYDVLNAAIDAETQQDPLDPVWVALLKQCRMAIGPLFCFFHADKADVLFSESGMQRVETQTNKGAYQEQRSKFKEANLAEGEYALELLQAFIELNQEDYPEWLDSDNFKKYKSLFIKSGTEFNELFPSQTPHRNYWLLRAKMYDVEENNIRNFLGDELFDALKTKDAMADPDFSDEEKSLLGKLKKAIANLTVALAVPIMNVRIGSNGLTVPAVTTFSQDDANNTRGGIDHKMIDTFIISCSNTGTDWINNAQTYLTNNKTEFPSWIGFVVAEEEDTSDNADFEAVFGM